MAFETKVGLLVGIGFIVCFAMVLSHRGRGDRISARMAYNVLAQHGRHDVTRATTIPNAFARFTGNRRRSGEFTGKLSAKRRTSTDAAPALRRPAGGTNASGGSRDHGAANATSSQPTVTVPATGSHGGQRDASGKGDVNGKPVWTWESIFGASETKTESGSTAAGDRPAPTHERAIGVPKLSPHRVDQLESPRSKPDVAMRRYVVKPHDTLWRVAKMMYGKATRENVQTIFDANRDRLSSLNGLGVGTELRVPNSAKMFGDRDGGSEARQRPKQRPAVSQEERRDVPKYYEVRQGDRYASIAERLLGDKSRWREIHALNMDIFPDPGKIRYGVRIRIPASRSVSQ